MLLSNVFNFSGVFRGSIVFKSAPSGRLALRWAKILMKLRYITSIFLLFLLFSSQGIADPLIRTNEEIVLGRFFRNFVIALSLIFEVLIILLITRNHNLRLFRLGFFLTLINFVLFYLIVTLLLGNVNIRISTILLTIILEVIIVILESIILSALTKLRYICKEQSIPIRFKQAILPTLIGNLASLGYALAALALYNHFS